MNINLHRIETRPSRKSVDTHNFFIDCDGHIKDKNIKLAINAIKQAGAFVRVLGSYPLESN
jgi:prephenate dehydratase